MFICYPINFFIIKQVIKHLPNLTCAIKTWDYDYIKFTYQET